MNYIFYIYDNVYILHISAISYPTMDGQKPQQKLPPKTPTKTPYDPPKTRLSAAKSAAKTP
jgi:hypothetical protein